MKSSKVEKRPIDPGRIRRVPPSGFSWIDRRFVREGFLGRLPPEANLLYFFLVAVSDSCGLSFYADFTVGRMLKLSAEELSQARARLLKAKLILYDHPLYQVLPLPEVANDSAPEVSRSFVAARGGEALSVGEILRMAMSKGAERKGKS